MFLRSIVRGECANEGVVKNPLARTFQPGGETFGALIAVGRDLDAPLIVSWAGKRMRDGYQCRHGQKQHSRLPKRRCERARSNHSAPFSIPIISFPSRSIHTITTRQRTMNGLSSYLEYGRRGVGFASSLPHDWNPDWLPCGPPSAIWDITYVKDG